MIWKNRLFKAVNKEMEVLVLLDGRYTTTWRKHVGFIPAPLEY
jgi:hypothetical protein